MKQIQPIKIWIDGQTKTATQLGSISILDNLATEAKFQYWLSDVNSETLSSGNLTMDGQDYIDWNSNPDINEDAYIWIANKLGLTLI
jgi:hypothetical protein